MPRTSFEAARRFDDDRFQTEVVHEDAHQKTMLGFFEPGQFVPVHAPGSTLTVYVREGDGVVVEGDDEHDVRPDDVVTVPADEDRGVRASEQSQMETLLVVSPPPGAAEHEPVKRGLSEGLFRPASTGTDGS